jgi:SAM-dependent methyltransferase
MIRACLRRLYYRLYPQLWFLFNPLKMYEFSVLLKGVNLKEDETVLDIGCGSGLQTLLIGKRVRRVVGIDISEAAIAAARWKCEHARRRVNAEFLCVKIEDAGFGDCSFDKVFSFSVLEHIPDYARVLTEAHRVLRTGGEMIFSVDSLETIEDPGIVETHQRGCGVYHYFRRDELVHILRSTGFQDIEVRALLRSGHSKRLFVKGLRNGFRYGMWQTLVGSRILDREERRCPGGKPGIFLYARCRKGG